MEPQVSSDFSGCSYSVMIDGLLTNAQGTMLKTFGWYDNEWGYSERLKDFLIFVA
jgi:glyceraldehyde 3-phosphate dehydrogenase